MDRIDNALQEIDKSFDADANFVVYDKNAIILNKYGKNLEQRGYVIKVLNLCNPEKSDAYNPFDYIKSNKDIRDMTTYIINHYFKEEPAKDKEMQNILFQALCFYLMKHRPKHEQNFSYIVKLLRAAEANDENHNTTSVLDLVFNEIKNENFDSIALKMYEIFKRNDIETRTNAINSLILKLNLFNYEDISELVTEDTIALNNILVKNKKIALFIIYSPTQNDINWLYELLTIQLKNLYNSNEKSTKSDIEFLCSPISILQIIGNVHYRKDDAYVIKRDLKKRREKRVRKREEDRKKRMQTDDEKIVIDENGNIV